MKDLIIIGAGGLGRETIFIIERINYFADQWNILGFLDDSSEKQGKRIDGYDVLGTVADAKKFSDAYFLCAVGNPYIRKLIVERLESDFEIKFATVIDPSCMCSLKRLNIGEGCVICSTTYITLDIDIGRHSYIGGNTTIGHDSKIGEFVSVYAGTNIAGTVTIGDNCEIGTGSKIIQQLHVGSDTIIGAGSVVIRDIPNNCVAAGVPARVIKSK